MTDGGLVNIWIRITIMDSINKSYKNIHEGIVKQFIYLLKQSSTE